MIDLSEVGIVKLQSAARMAGLRFKNGAPGYDKAGIIAKLELYPSIKTATIACLERWEKAGGFEAKPLPRFDFDDFTDDQTTEEEKKPFPSNPKPIPAVTDFRLEQRVSGLEDREQTSKRALHKVVSNLARTTTLVEDYVSRIEKLEQRTPTDIHIPNLPVIKLDGTEHLSYPKLLKYLHINRRVILTGSAGTGKSMAVKNAAAHFGLPFYLQPPVTQGYELIGHRDGMGVFHETPLFHAYTKGGLILLDEADASMADALLVANPIFDGNGFAMFGDGKLHEMHKDFLAVFNMNTDGNGASMEYPGRTRLDGATLARFGCRIHWGVDSTIEESMALGQTKWYAAVLAVRRFMTERAIVDVNATPRHTKTGAMLLAAGLPKSDVLNDVLKSGAVAQAWNDVISLSAVDAFLRG